jgi:hypothetical protein
MKIHRLKRVSSTSSGKNALEAVEIRRRQRYTSVRHALACLVVVLSLPVAGAVCAEPAGSADVHGLCAMSSKPFPRPAGSVEIPLPGGDFETGGKLPPRWTADVGKVVVADDAPQGKAYFRMEIRQGKALRTPWGVEAEPGRPYFLSFWLKSRREEPAVFTFSSQENLPSCGCDSRSLPDTGNQWKRVGCCFWMPAQGKTIQFHIVPREDGAAGEFLAVDDFHLRTATQEEMLAAYAAEHLHLPPYDVTPRPGDGQNLALSVAKWEGRAGISGKPFLIWALGSSWTDAQEDGYGLIDDIRKRFPHAPPIVYKLHAGSGTPWDYVWPWVEQFVAAEQPDLIFTYTLGTPEGLDAMLTEIRRHTTADVIVPSIHFNLNAAGWPDKGARAADLIVSRDRLHSKVPPTAAEIEAGHARAEEIRAICRKHKAEYVENRRDLAEYLTRTGVKVEELSHDGVHQGAHGRIRLWDSILRHITHPDHFSYAPESVERRIGVAGPAPTATEQVSLSGNWTIAKDSIRTGTAGSRLTVHFTGNRIDLLGRKTPRGGTVRVFVDGKPAEDAPAFFSTFIQPALVTEPGKQERAPRGDFGPHAVELREHLLPQTWTITVTSNVGDYRLEGSVTGPDGEGNVARTFVSRSGQIAVDPRFWRHGREEKKGEWVHYGNVVGDKFTFDVVRAARGKLSFQADEPVPLAEPLVENLPNRQHLLEIVTAGDGEVTIDGLYVFEPLER